MRFLPKPASQKAPEEHFTGDAWFDLIVRGDEPSRLRSSVVRFSPGARNDWHRHAVGQVLVVTEGLGRIQSRGERSVAIHPGDVIHTEPGEWHWHGAAPDRFMTHLTMYEAAPDGEETTWGETVSDDDYAAQPEERPR